MGWAERVRGCDAGPHPPPFTPQITASVTFLPLLTRPCTFDLLIYADRDASVPVEWEDSDARMIEDASTVRLRSFTTKVHRVDALVAYRAEPDDVC